MDCIYVAHFLKPMVTQSALHYTVSAMQGTSQLVGSRCLAHGHLNTLGARRSRGIEPALNLAVTSQPALPPESYCCPIFLNDNYIRKCSMKTSELRKTYISFLFIIH